MRAAFRSIPHQSISLAQRRDALPARPMESPRRGSPRFSSFSSLRRACEGSLRRLKLKRWHARCPAFQPGVQVAQSNASKTWTETAQTAQTLFRGKFTEGRKREGGKAAKEPAFADYRALSFRYFQISSIATSASRCSRSSGAINRS